MSAKKTENDIVEPINPEVENPEVTKVEESNPTEPVNPEVTATEENNSAEPIEPTTPEIEAEEKAKKEAEEKAKAEGEAKQAEEEAKAKAETEKKSAETNSVKLRVLIAFTDKYTDESYAVNDVITVDKERAKELLADPRRLVEKLN